jgi:hypothetical protein
VEAFRLRSPQARLPPAKGRPGFGKAVLRKQVGSYRERVVDFERKLPDLATQYYDRFEIVANDKQHFGTARVGPPLDSAAALEGLLSRYGYKPAERQKVLENVKSEWASGKLTGDRTVKIRFPISGSEGRTPEIDKLPEEKLSKGTRYETPENRQYEHTAVNPKTGSRVGWNGKEWVPIGPITVFKGDRRIQVSPDALPEAIAKGWSPGRKQFVDISLLIGPDFWRSPPQWYSDAVAAGVDLAAVPEYEKPGDPPRPFSLHRSLVEHWLFETPGVLLFGIGVGLIFGVTVRKTTWARS